MNHISRYFRGINKKWSFPLLVILLTGLLTGVAFAQTDGIWMYIKDGQADSLIADGKSQTIVMVDLSDCAWYPSSGPGGQIQVEFLNTLGLTASPPSVFSTKGELGSPFELQIKAGTQSGTAKITATAKYCSEGNVMVFGQCSSKEEQDNPTCTGEFLITLQPDSISDSGDEPPPESEESQDLAVSISCTPNPKKGKNVTCSANASGVKDGESLDYIWSLEGAAGSKTKDNTFTWKPAEKGYYEISVEVIGGDRRAKGDLRVEVSEGESSADEGDKDDASGSDVDSLRTSLESFLKTAGLSKIHPARLAAAGGGAATLIAIWMIIQHRAGVPMEKLEQAVGQWRWREGVKVPESPPEADEKAPTKKPDQLPETKKTDPVKKEPPKTLPEEEKAKDAAKASSDAEVDKSPEPDISAAAAAKKPPKSASGETGEERAERLVDDLEDYRAAVDKTLSDFKKRLENVPKEVKESKFWKEKVAPKLKKLDDMGIGSKSAKLKEFLRITKELLQVRKRVDAEMSMFSKEDREGVVWLVRGLQAGQEGLSKLHSQLITDPAIKAAKAGLPKKQAEAVEKFLKKHQSEIETMLKGIRDLPMNLGKKMGKALHLDQNKGIVKKDTDGVLHKKWKYKAKPFDITRSPREKLGPVIKYVEDTGSAIMKKLGRIIIPLRDTRPGQK
jgi:hypothetical protein